MRISDWSSDVCSSDLISVTQSEHNRKRSVFNGPYPVPEVGSVPAFYLRAPSPRHSVPVKSGRRPQRKAAMPSLPSNPTEAVAMLFASHSNYRSRSFAKLPRSTLRLPPMAPVAAWASRSAILDDKSKERRDGKERDSKC